jgi:hypothetical protein
VFKLFFLLAVLHQLWSFVQFLNQTIAAWCQNTLLLKMNRMTHGPSAVYRSQVFFLLRLCCQNCLAKCCMSDCIREFRWMPLVTSTGEKLSGCYDHSAIRCWLSCHLDSQVITITMHTSKSLGALLLSRVFHNIFLVCWLLLRLLQKPWRESVLILERSCMDWWDFVMWHPSLPFISSSRTCCQDSGAPWVHSYYFSQHFYQEVL